MCWEGKRKTMSILPICQFRPRRAGLHTDRCLGNTSTKSSERKNHQYPSHSVMPLRRNASASCSGCWRKTTTGSGRRRGFVSLMNQRGKKKKRTQLLSSFNGQRRGRAGSRGYNFQGWHRAPCLAVCTGRFRSCDLNYKKNVSRWMQNKKGGSFSSIIQRRIPEISQWIISQWIWSSLGPTEKKNWQVSSRVGSMPGFSGPFLLFLDRNKATVPPLSWQQD